MTQGKKTVIIIDSDANLIEDLKRRFMLEPDFEIVNVAYSGIDGFGKVQFQQPEFIIMNNPLPDSDPVQMLQNFAVVSPNSKKIVSLEFENPIATTQLMQAGADYTISKPYSVEKLIDVLRGFSQKQSPQNNNAGMQPGFGSAPAQPVGGYGNLPQGGMQNPSLDQLRNAMNQYSHEVEREPSQVSPQQHMQQMQPGGFGGYQQQPQQQQFQQPMQQQFTPPANFNNMRSGAGSMQPGGFGGYQQPQAPNMGMGGYPPQGGGMYGDGFPGFEPNMQGHPNGGGGFRTLKQTILAVNCPKGGVGKTTISKELAIAYSLVRINGQPLKVCLVDCDLDFGDVANMLKLNPYPNISHWTSDIDQKLKENPHAELKFTQQQIEQKYLITHQQTNLKILAAPANHTDSLDISGRDMEIIIDNLKNCDFDVIILDTGNNTKDYTLIALDKAATILMITTMDVTTISDTYLLLQTLKSIQFPVSKIKLILNRVPKQDKDIDVSEIVTTLGFPIMGYIPEFPKIRQINNSGNPASMGKDCEYTAAIRDIANKLVPVFNRAMNPSAKGKGKARKDKSESNNGGFFSKLFKKK